jgi:hypothetical protein
MQVEILPPGPPSGSNAPLTGVDPKYGAPPALDTPTTPDDLDEDARDHDGATYVEAPTLFLPPDFEGTPIVSDEENPFEAVIEPIADARVMAHAIMAEASSSLAGGAELVARGTASSPESAHTADSWLDSLRDFVSKYVTEWKASFGESALPTAAADSGSVALEPSVDPMGTYAKDFRAKWRARRTDYRAHRHVALAGCGGKVTPTYWVRQHVLV